MTRIEKRIQSFGLKEVPTRTIGQMMMVELHALDKVAYVRFASVPRVPRRGGVRRPTHRTGRAAILPGR